MHHHIADTTASEALGNVYQNKLFEIDTGQYIGRLVAVIQTSPSDIALTWSDNRGLSWTTPVTIVTDAADQTCDCLKDPDHNLHLVYTQQSTHYLLTRQLTFSGGQWTAGSAVTIYNGAACFDPSILRTPNSTLWVSFSIYTAPNRRVHAKASTDNGATWGTGTADSGDPLSDPGMFLWSTLICDDSAVRAMYVDQDYGIRMRSRQYSSELWSAAATIATGDSLTKHFDAAIAEDGRLGVVFDNDGLYYREFDGANWGALVSVDPDPPTAPQLVYRNNIPVIVYLKPFAGNQLIAMYTDRSTGTFGAPRAMDGRARTFDSVLLYHAASGTYDDLTTEAASLTAADIVHAQSGCLLAGAGDAAYVGMDMPFRFARCNLSTAGVGGTLACSYWDGEQWRVFTPHSGSNHLDGAYADLLFWTDYASLPGDWQKRTVDSHQRFWIKLECTSTYTTGPVADQLSAVSQLGRIMLRR